MSAVRASVVVLAAGLGGSANAVPTVLYSNIASSLTSDVPGGAGLKFESFGQPHASRTGNQWIMRALNTGADATDAMYIGGLGAAGTLLAQEGVTEAEPGRVIEALNDPVAGINVFGEWAAAVNLAGDTLNDQVVLSGIGPALGIVFREGDAISAIADSLFGSMITDPQISDTGEIAVRALDLGGNGVSRDTNGALLGNGGNVLLAQRGVTVPSNQLPPAETYDTFTMQQFRMSPDSTTWSTKANLNVGGLASSVAVRNNEVILQSTANFAGLSDPVNFVYGSPTIAGNNDVWLSGVTVTEESFVARNSDVVARSGEPLVPGSSEFWDGSQWAVPGPNAFFLRVGDSLGNYVIGGFTDGATDQNGVLVYNGTDVILREGDGIDLNGDSLLNDDAYFDITGLANATLDGRAESGFLSDDGFLYLVGGLRNGLGEPIGEAFFRVQVPAPGAAVIMSMWAGVFARRVRRDVQNRSK